MGTETEKKSLQQESVLFMVPFPRNERYIGKSANNASIRDQLSGAQAENHQRLALWGLGGVG